VEPRLKRPMSLTGPESDVHCLMSAF